MQQSNKQKVFNIVSNSMNVSENTEVWKISPELDYDTMRWNYKNNGLFEIGTLIESLSSGLIGRIIRRGANYLICVTEDGKMFKNWLKDVVEVYEIGTPEYREYTQRNTPGQPVEDYVGSDSKRKRINKSIKRYFKIRLVLMLLIIKI
jgi:hypothetical protein